jgi:hypothetical protein
MIMQLTSNPLSLSWMLFSFHLFVKYGLNHCVTLIEAKKTSPVIAHNVDPIELVVFIPAQALCPMPQDGRPLRYCQRQGSSRHGCAQKRPLPS